MSSTTSDMPVEISCAFIQNNAAGLAALREDDPDRVAARTHAATCPACANQLKQGAYTIAWIDRAAKLKTPDPQVIHALAMQVRAQLAAQSARAKWAWITAAAALLIVEGAALLGMHSGGDEITWAFALTLVVASAAGLAGVLHQAQRRYLALPGVASLAAIAVLGAPQGPIDSIIGTHCLSFELATAAAPVLLGAAYLKVRGVQHSHHVLLASGFCGAVVGQAVLLHACPEGQTIAHLLVFHAGGIALAAALALGLETLAQRLRRPLTMA